MQTLRKGQRTFRTRAACNKIWGVLEGDVSHATGQVKHILRI